MITVLCCHSRSVYKKLGVNCYDQKRDALTYSGYSPIIAHPPCRSFSRLHGFVSIENKIRDHEIADHCITLLRRNGGILEQPARSTMKKVFDLGQPYYIDQYWFGLPFSKPTWLWTFNCELNDLPLMLNPVRNTRKTMANMSSQQRSYTTVEMATWLIDSIKRSIYYETSSDEKKKF